MKIIEISDLHFMLKHNYVSLPHPNSHNLKLRFRFLSCKPKSVSLLNQFINTYFTRIGKEWHQ